MCRSCCNHGALGKDSLNLIKASRVRVPQSPLHPKVKADLLDGAKARLSLVSLNEAGSWASGLFGGHSLYPDHRQPVFPR